MLFLLIIHQHLRITIMHTKYLVFFLILTANCFAQNDSAQIKSGEYKLVLGAGGGMSYYMTEPGVPHHLHTVVNRFSPSASLRLMWYPDHRLRVGLETGWMTFYKYKIVDEPINGKLKLTAIPVLLVWSMQIGKRLNVYGGAGSYFITTRLDYVERIKSETFRLGWMLAANYAFNVSHEISLAPELKWYNASESKDHSLNLQLLILWNFYKW